MDTIEKEPTATPASAKLATSMGVIFGATPGMPRLFKSNFDYQLVRGMLAGAYGEGAANCIRPRDGSWTATSTAGLLNGDARLSGSRP
jgi:hypothetical protein